MADQAGTPKPLDAERARLRAAGLTDDEISRVFVAREHGASQQQAGAAGGAAGQAPTSGVLTNLSAVWGYARGIIPTMASQVVTVGSRAAPPQARVAAGISLIVKVGLVLVLAYAVRQEWQQHIVSATQIATATADYAARTKKAEADRAEADARKAEAEAHAANQPASVSGVTTQLPYIKIPAPYPKIPE